MPGVADALVASHFPADEGRPPRPRATASPSRSCLLYQAALVARRGRRVQSGRGAAIGPAGERVGRWLDSLPFELTGDQRRALDEIDARPRRAASRCSGC